MERRKLFSAVLIISTFMVLQCNGIFFGKRYNIRKFLSTSMPIWTHTTTIGSDEYCEVDVLQQLYKDVIYYTHSSYEVTKGKLKKVHRKMEGDFDKYDMYAHEKGHVTQNLKHEIVFLDETHHCAVILVLPMSDFAGRRSMELRVWNSSIHTGPSHKCLKHYYSVESHGHVIYKPYCQKLVLNKHPSLLPHQQLQGRNHSLTIGQKPSG
ncbi:uncharacterized protein LOC119458295 [Dermacentor silvarum]|uniref:uncharacterized protein LOC119458295 n=1 Tax=Dermacentor silvarum TaxID=543639 RepID=UPI001899A85A|nr:uncharacterized protein LOC119458295 [Dermacentor silvarum]